MKKLILLSTTLAATLLMAEAPKDQSIKTNAKLGYMKTDGNTNTETFSLEAKIKKDWGKNSLALVLDAQYGNTENATGVSEVIKNKYFAELQYAYAFTSALSATLVVGYKNDEFSSYNYQSYVGPGVKYKAYKSDKQKLNLEASLLYSSDEVQEQFASNTALEEKYGSYKAKLTYELQIVENLKFNQELSYRASMNESQNYFAFSNSQLSSKISDIFSAGLGYKVDYAHLVPAGIEQRDTTLSAFISIDY